MTTLPLELWKDNIGEVAQELDVGRCDAVTAGLDQLQPDVRDVALADYCRHGGEAADDQRRLEEKAIELGLTITRRKLREEALGEFARRLGTTREEAMEAVDQLPISNEQKAYLRKIMPETESER